MQKSKSAGTLPYLRKFGLVTAVLERGLTQLIAGDGCFPPYGVPGVAMPCFHCHVQTSTRDGKSHPSTDCSVLSSTLTP